MSDVMTIDQVRAQHEDLYDRALRDGPELRSRWEAGARPNSSSVRSRDADGNGSEEFIREVRVLLDSITRLSSQVQSFDEYRRLSHMAVQWQNIFTYLDLPTSVSLSPPSDKLLPPQVPPVSGTGQNALTEQELDYWIKTHARFFAYTRIAKTKSLSTAEEMELDHRMAYVFLASDILDGKINLVKRIAPNSYEHLELVWMEDLKRVRAYLLWIERGGGFGLEPTRRNYFDVCDHLRNMLTNSGIKAPTAAFAPIHRYVAERYLTRGRVDVDQNEYAHWLVGHKALHLYQENARVNAKENWEHAETYVKAFYENIAAAVLERDYESTLAVLRALQCDPSAAYSPYQIISAFEVALVTYFVPASSISKIWDDYAHSDAPGNFSLISEVRAPVGLPAVEVPENCRGRFELGNGTMRFRGVMSTAQRDALIKALTSERRAIETLYERTRGVSFRSTL